MELTKQKLNFNFVDFQFPCGKNCLNFVMFVSSGFSIILLSDATSMFRNNGMSQNTLKCADIESFILI